MKKQTLTLIVLTASLIIAHLRTFGQNMPAATSCSVLQLTELTENGKQIPIAADFRIVEPNSKVQVTFDTNCLNTLLAGNVLDQNTSNKLTQLRDMLTHEGEAMQNINEAFDLYNKNKPDSVWMPLLQRVYDYTALILVDKKSESRRVFTTTLDELMAANSPTTDKDRLFIEYSALFATASKMIPLILQEVQAAAKAQGVYIQLGAWLDAGKVATPIHINGFDDYTPQTPTSVERFIVTLNEQQQKDLSAITALADSVNGSGLGVALKQVAIDAGQGVSSKLTSLPSFTQATALLDSLRSLMSQDKAQLGAIKETLTNTYTDVLGFTTELSDLIKKYNQPITNTDANALLQQVNSDVLALTADVKTFQTDLTTDVTKIDSQINGAVTTLQGQITTLKTSLSVLKSTLDTDIINLGTSASFFQQLILGQQVAASSHDFTDKVRQLTIDALPQNATIDLTTAGSRDQGSKLFIKLSTGKAGQAVKDQYNRELDLYFCSIYARTTVGFLFVSPAPIFQRSGDNALFRFAPSYSILLKGFWKSAKGARKSVLYHTFFDPGLGLNFSALDFKGDGSMALGVGGVLTIFNDFVQVGGGVNTFDGRGYVFFGFKLPVGSLIMR